MDWQLVLMAFILGAAFGVLATKIKFYRNVGDYKSLNGFYKMVPYDWFFYKVHSLDGHELEMYQKSVVAMMEKIKK